MSAGRKVREVKNMYPEFVPIYIGLAVIIVLLVVILILLVKRTANNAAVSKRIMATNTVSNGGSSVVFCKSCATQFDATQRFCPKCGTPR